MVLLAVLLLVTVFTAMQQNDQLKAFQDPTKPVYDQFADKIGKDLVKEVKDKVAELSK